MDWKYTTGRGWWSGRLLREDGYPDSVAIRLACGDRWKIVAIRTIPPGSSWRNEVRRYANGRRAAA